MGTVTIYNGISWAPGSKFSNYFDLFESWIFSWEKKNDVNNKRFILQNQKFDLRLTFRTHWAVNLQFWWSTLSCVYETSTVSQISGFEEWISYYLKKIIIWNSSLTSVGHFKGPSMTHCVLLFPTGSNCWKYINIRKIKKLSKVTLRRRDIILNMLNVKIESKAVIMFNW